MDTLSEQTAIYTRLLSERNRNREFENAKKMVKLIQAEIVHRQATQHNSLPDSTKILVEQDFVSQSEII